MNPRRCSTGAAGSEARDPSLSGRKRGADPLRLPLDLEPRIDLGHPGRSNGELRKAIRATQRPPIEPTLRLELRRLAPDSHRLPVNGKASNRRTSTFTSEQAHPRPGEIGAQRRHSAQPGHHDPTTQLLRPDAHRAHRTRPWRPAHRSRLCSAPKERRARPFASCLAREPIAALETGRPRARKHCEGPRAWHPVAVQRILVRLTGLGVFVAVLAGASNSVSASRAQQSVRRASPPKVLHLVDPSRKIRLPDGRRISRPVTTYLWYPPPARVNGPWPLVVFGHGFASTPFRYRRLLRAWAAAGYLVAAPVFPLGNANAPGGPNESDIVNQPRDMSFVITRLLAASNAPENPLHGLIDPARIAVAGQSDGAETAFAAAYEKPWHDRRVRAAVILSGAELGRHVPLVPGAGPLLAVQGTADRINPPVYTRDLFRAVDRPKFLLLLRRAGHLGPYTAPGPRLAAVERVSIAFLNHYLRTGTLRAIARAAAPFPADALTSEP